MHVGEADVIGVEADARATAGSGRQQADGPKGGEQAGRLCPHLGGQRARWVQEAEQRVTARPFAQVGHLHTKGGEAISVLHRLDGGRTLEA